jgi:hypothetical protein
MQTKVQTSIAAYAQKLGVDITGLTNDQAQAKIRAAMPTQK